MVFPQGGLDDIGKDNAGLHLPCLFPEYGRHLFCRVASDNHRHSLLDDAGLLCGDFLQGIAEQIAMVKSYAGDHAELGSDDIGTVKPASESGLDHCPVHLHIGEPSESQTGGNLEKRELEPVQVIIVPGQEIIHVFLSNEGRTVGGRLPSVNDPHSLPEIQNMRRCVDAHFQTTGSKSRGQHAGSGALAVGPGNVDSPVSPVRVPEQFPEFLHPVETRLVRLPERDVLD